MYGLVGEDDMWLRQLFESMDPGGKKNEMLTTLPI